MVMDAATCAKDDVDSHSTAAADNNERMIRVHQVSSYSLNDAPDPRKPMY
jgi:hypothetical protein